MLTFRTAAFLVATFSLGACAGPQTFDPYPVTDNGPNPAPLPGYRLICNTVSVSTDPMQRGSTTACRQDYGPPPLTALRARG